MKNKITLTLVLVLVTFLLAGLVTAFGVGSPYWKGHPLKMYPGETKIINLNLQNNVGDADVVVKAQVTEGADIAKLLKDTYIVKAKTINTMVPLKVTLPKDVTENKHVTVEIKTVKSGEGGMVVMGTGMKVSFDVILTEIPEKVKQQRSISTITWSAAILILIIILYLFLRRKIIRSTSKSKIYRSKINKKRR